MEYNDYWSRERQDSSYDILYNGKCMEPCAVKHFRDEKKYGTVSVIEGITNGNWEVVLEDETVEKYDSCEALVKSGWVVD